MIQNRSAVLWWSSLVVMIHLFELVPDFENFMGLGLKSNNENLAISMVFSAVVGAVLLYNGIRFATNVYVNHRRIAVESENINALWECAKEMMEVPCLKSAGPMALFSVLEKVFADPGIIIDNNYSEFIIPIGKGGKIWKQIDIRNKRAKQVNRARRFQCWVLDVFPPTAMFFWAFCFILPEFYVTWKLVLFG